MLNASIVGLTGEIVLLSDANTEIDPNAVRQLVRWFRSPRVGVVCGRLVLTDPRTGRNVDSLYWKYETFLKQCEGRLGALLGANGAIYAIRKSLYQKIPSETIIDDFVIPLLAKLRSGCTIIYDSTAVATEETPPDVRSEFRRRARDRGRRLSSIGLLWKAPGPQAGVWVAFTFLSHKIIRWFCPFFMIGTLVSNALLLDRPLYRIFLMGQFGFYLVAVLGAFLPPGTKFLKPLRLATMFTSMKKRRLVGWILCRLFGGQSGTWTRTGGAATGGGPSQ